MIVLRQGNIIQPEYSADGNKITGITNPDGTVSNIEGTTNNIPTRVGPKSWRNVAGHMCMPNHAQLGAEAASRARVPIYDSYVAGETMRIVYILRGDWTEGTSTNIGVNMQLGIDFYDNGTLTPCVSERTNSTTIVIDSVDRDTNGYVIFNVVCPTNVNAGQSLHMWTWMKNGWLQCKGSDIASRRQSGAASTFKGDLFRSQVSNNNALALFTDSSLSISGMSDTTREGLTNSDPTDANGYHIRPFMVLKYTDLVSIDGIGDSTHQPGGSSGAVPYDDTYTTGIATKLLGRRFPISNYAAASEKFEAWTDGTSKSTVRKRLINLFPGTYFALGLGVNNLSDTLSNLQSQYDQFMNLPEFSTRKAIGMTISATSSTTTIDANQMTIPSTAWSDTRATRKWYNNKILSANKFIRVFDVDALIRSYTYTNTLAAPTNARTLTGSMSSGSNVLTLTSGSFTASDYKLRVTVPGAGTLAGANLMLIGDLIPTSATTANVVTPHGFPVNAAASVTGVNVFIGSNHYSAGFGNSVVDYIHKSHHFYNTLYKIAETGLFMGTANFASEIPRM